MTNKNPKGLIDPKAEAAETTMRVLKEMAAARWITPTEEEKEKIASFELPEHLRRDSAIPYELMHRGSAERIKNWYDEDRLLRELFSGERGDTLIRSFKNFFPRISAGDYEKAWEHISLISEQLPDMLAQIKYQSEFIDSLSEAKREECGELFVECFRSCLGHYLKAQISKLKQISIDEELGARTGNKTNPSQGEIARVNVLARSKIESFFAQVDEFHEAYKDSVYTRLTSAQVDPRAIMPKKSPSKVLLVTTGGTIESFYNPEEGTPNTVPQEEKSCIPRALSSITDARGMLRSGEVTAVELTQAALSRIEGSQSGGVANIKPQEYDHYPLCMEDSKDVTANHLKNLAQYIYEHDEYESIIVVHGTDTMPIHGRKLRELLAEYDADLGAGGDKEKKIIFAGAMEPLRDKNKEWRPTADGWEHLSLAFRAAKDPAIEPDTYFTFQNQLLKSSEWNKRREVDEATNTVTDAGFVERLQPTAHEQRVGHIWQ